MRFEGPAWGPRGYDNPKSGYWRTKEGGQIPIGEMKDDHLINCIKFLRRKFGEEKVTEWSIYKNLTSEAMRRNIDDRADWDS